MSDTERTTATPKSATPDFDLEDHFEPDDLALGRHLGLRAPAFSAAGNKGTHPDQRPCPPWCWVGQHDEYDHEIELDRPLVAVHSFGATPHVIASNYRADQGHDRVVHPATIEFTLDQVGQGAPQITVYLRSYSWVEGETRQQRHFRKLVKLSLTDADEVARVLQHLIRVAEG